MLLQFSVTNHRSIKNIAVISMKAASDKTMKEVLLSPDGKKNDCTCNGNLRCKRSR